jgi:hypothetical protein
MKKSRLNICGVYLCYEELRDLFNYDVLDAALSNVKMKRSSSQKYFGVGRANLLGLVFEVLCVAYLIRVPKHRVRSIYVVRLVLRLWNVILCRKI